MKTWRLLLIFWNSFSGHDVLQCCLSRELTSFQNKAITLPFQQIISKPTLPWCRPQFTTLALLETLTTSTLTHRSGPYWFLAADEHQRFSTSMLVVSASAQCVRCFLPRQHPKPLWHPLSGDRGPDLVKFLEHVKLLCPTKNRLRYETWSTIFVL